MAEVRDRGSVLTTEEIGGARKRARHSKPNLVSRVAAEHRKRLMSFSLIGFSVFALGICFQAFLVRILGMPASLAYIIQVVLSVQANFLANFRWTWSDRNAPFWRSCVRYNVKRTVGTLLSFALYPLLVMIGMNYLIANAVLVVMLTPANYILGHWWTFASGDSSARASSTRPMPPRVQLRQRLVVSAGVRRADLIHIPERTEPATPLCMQCGDVQQCVDDHEGHDGPGEAHQNHSALNSATPR